MASTATRRTIRLLFAEEPQYQIRGAFQITTAKDGRECYHYSKQGQGTYRVEKLDAPESAYTVTVGKGGGCECKGFRFGGACRHLSGLEALLAKGKVL